MVASLVRFKLVKISSKVVSLCPEEDGGGVATVGLARASLNPFAMYSGTVIFAAAAAATRLGSLKPNL